MTIEEIKNMVEKEEYDFLRTNPHLSGRLVFLTLGGSYAYGTNVETSDVDIRGCALNRKSDLLGLSNFEQVVNTETDTTVYSFNKLVNLLINCNPNTIELLGCKPEHYFLLTDVGRQMIENRGLSCHRRRLRLLAVMLRSSCVGSKMLLPKIGFLKPRRKNISKGHWNVLLNPLKTSLPRLKMVALNS